MNFSRSWARPDRPEAVLKSMLHWILTFVQLISAVFIVILVLLQRGKGAEAGAGFGAGASGTVFGARGATTALSRATAIFAAIFMLNSLALTYLSTRPHQQQTSILDIAGEKAPAPGAPHQSNSAPAMQKAPAAAPGTATPPQPPQQQPQPQPPQK
jgi:preprotein translocase subunit SecG